MIFSNRLDLTYWHRALQVAIATLLAVIFYHLFAISYGYWVVISAIITVRANIGASIKRAKDRMLGTLLGVLIGVALIALFPGSKLLLFIATPIFLFLAVFSFNISYAYCIFFTSILLMIILGHGAILPWHFAALRIIDTLVGLLLGLFVVHVFWPSCSKDALYKNLQTSIQLSQNYFENIVSITLENKKGLKITSEQMASLQKSLRESMNAFREFSYEPSIMKVSAEAIFSIILCLNTVYDILMAMTLVGADEKNMHVQKDERESIYRFAKQIMQTFSEISQALIEKRSSLLISVNLTQNMLAEERIRALLSAQKLNNLKLILFAYELKKMGAELIYLSQAIAQLNTINSNLV